MNSRSPSLFIPAVASLASLLLVTAAILSTSPSKVTAATAELAKITIDYPLQGSVFPPEITAPTFLWHDPAPSATHWVIEVSAQGRSEKIRPDTIRIASAGELLQRGPIDTEAGPPVDLTPAQASSHTWTPDPGTWDKIKKLSAKSAATITFTGLADAAPVSSGEVTISTSADPVGAPIFYRNVPLMVSPTEKGTIAPLPAFAIPLIKWQVRDIAQPQSHTVMGNLPTCANCHSFAADGKTMGLDMDGPRNDKGLYALVPVSKDITIANKDLLRWSSFQVDPAVRSTQPSVKRFGFMSQVSPDGRFVVTGIGPPNIAHTTKNSVIGFASGLSDRLFNTNFNDLAFNQVFFPTRGILAWYDRSAQTLRPLPGADDPKYVQTSAFWSPDGKFLIFSRALARDPYPPGRPKALHANDPNETQIQYDLYKIPFNNGRGGKAVPVLGASNNGMSNDFPKVSPDGKWIVWVENKNGLLMRPDSRLFILPFAGGKPRLMQCNTPLMNSWHTFSPNGHWLAFSSKARGPFTQLMLTHIDAKGDSSPAIMVENTTLANRAVNIPEFVNVPPGGLEKIDPQALQFYRLVDQAFKMAQNDKIPQAIETLRSALKENPDDAMAHYNLGTLLANSSQTPDALVEYQKAIDLAPENTLFLEHLGVLQVMNGQPEKGIALLQKAIALKPDAPEYQFNLGYILETRGDLSGALVALQKSVDLSEHKIPRFLAELASVDDKTGHPAEALQLAQQALALAQEQNDQTQTRTLQNALSQYQKDAATKQP